MTILSFEKAAGSQTIHPGAKQCLTSCALCFSGGQGCCCYQHRAGVETLVVSHNGPGPPNFKESVESAPYPYWASLCVADCISAIYIKGKISIDFTGVGSEYPFKMLFSYSVSVSADLFLCLFLMLKDISIF